MNGLTFFLSKKSSSAIVEFEQVILKMYADTFFGGNENKKMNFVMNDITNMGLDDNSESRRDALLYITGVCDNATEIGLEYKWITQFTHR
jgi:hypothetical protein